MPLNIQTKQVIDVKDWDDLVEETYGRPYNYQQQDGCKGLGLVEFEVPMSEPEDFDRETIPEIVNDEVMGVSFKTWLARNPTQPLDLHDDGCEIEPWYIQLWWLRNFYPNLDMVANDLYNRGLLPAGSYTINIDW